MALPRAASRRHAPASSTQNSSSNLTDPPIREPPHRRGPAAHRARPETRSRKATRPRTRQPRQEPQQSASRDRKPPRNRGQPAAAVVSRRAARRTPQRRHVRHRTVASQSPRGPRDSDRSIAKTRLELSSRVVSAAVCLRARSGGAKRCRSFYFWPRTSRARLARSLRAPRAPKQVSACRACRAALSA